MLAIQRTAIDEIRTRANDSVAIMRTELEGAAARRREEAEASLRRMNEEAKIREEAADAKHRREMDLQRGYQESQLTREREQRAADAKAHTEMISMIQNNNAQQTQVVVASMQNKTDAMTVIKEMLTLAMPLLPMLSGQGDPAVEITKAVSTSLESMSRLASGDKPVVQQQQQTNGKGMVRANGQANGQKGAAPSADAAGKKERLIAKVGKLFQTVNAAGYDPEVMLDHAIAHYEAEKAAENETDEPDDDAEGDEDGEDGQTKPHAAKRSKRSKKRGAVSTRVAGRHGGKSAPASQSAVGRRPAAHGRPAATGSARGNSAGGKRERKA